MEPWEQDRPRPVMLASPEIRDGLKCSGTRAASHAMMLGEDAFTSARGWQRACPRCGWHSGIRVSHTTALSPQFGAA